ncbi:MAG: type II toxin-antitoxin system HicB family antitoxin [Alphaproteobacteria bacterium]|nr:type II toxin-antitoxin system HicB family antitoxin [Alphaproteobacteria bacterium]MBF0394395.1 type II toxin-antitoxin system HicB family antitoxin [Alphaproteobacteria bacterium]
MHPYPIKLRPLSPVEGEGWLAEVPDLPGCMSDGPTPAAAVEAVQDAISCWLEAAAEDGRPVPQPRASAA